MGTRADFYVRSNNNMEWIGSTAYDGYPDGIDNSILTAVSEPEFRVNVEKFLKGDGEGTFPSEGWPWPWNTSTTTDYSYIFENGKVMASCFGGSLFDPLQEEQEDKEDDNDLVGYFPDMSEVKNVKLGKGSGLTIITSKNN